MNHRDFSPMFSPLPSRRSFLKAAGLGLAGWPVASALLSRPAIAVAQTVSATPSAPPLPPLNRFPRMMQDWLIRRMDEWEGQGKMLRDAVTTKAAAEDYVKKAQERTREAFGPMPEKTPLNAKVTRTVEREGYRIENVYFESRPNYFVTGNLYVPTGRKGPMPGVIGVCGHSLNGKAEKAYQAFAQNLARLGYVCFLFDPVGQGERFQYLADDRKKSRMGGGVAEHIQMGNSQTLVGEFLGAWFAWDGIRALDYLLTRPEVDPKHIGVTGNSGGGTQTTWLCGLEPRFTMGAPSCFVTTFRRNVENELPADTEQCPPKVLALGLDHCDFLAAMAPKPVIIMAQEKDYFDARGSNEAYERLKPIWAQLGKPDNIQLHIGPDPHGYTQANREAMYRFFNRATGGPNVPAEPGLTPEPDEVLLCTPTGQVADLNSRTLMSFTSESAKALASQRPKLRGDELRNAVRSVLRVAPLDVKRPPEYRILRNAGARQYPTKGYCTYAVETETDVFALLTRLSDESLTSRIPAGAQKAILYISHRSADAELREEPLVKELLGAAAEAAFFACDVRGIGDSQPNTCGTDQFLRPYGNHFFYAAHSFMLDRPLLGQRVFDVLRVIQILKAAGHQGIHLVGRGWGALPAAFAALLSENVTQVTLKNALVSYEDIATNETYKWPYAVMLPGVLKQFDLPDVYAELQSKKLLNTEVWGAADGMT
jgi:dienelactone hydrolase